MENQRISAWKFTPEFFLMLFLAAFGVGGVGANLLWEPYLQQGNVLGIYMLFQLSKEELSTREYFFYILKYRGGWLFVCLLGSFSVWGAALGDIDGSDSWLVPGRRLSVGSSSVWSGRDGRWCSFVSAPGTLLFARNYISDGRTCPQIRVSSTFSRKSQKEQPKSIAGGGIVSGRIYTGDSAGKLCESYFLEFCVGKN